MKTLLISLENTLVAFGIRMISAALKQLGFETEVLFLPREFNHLETPEETGRIVEWIRSRDAALIGISLMSSHMLRALQLQKNLKSNLKAPIIWGGIHPTLRPEECLEYADLVCIGEGEYPMIDLVSSMKYGRPIDNIRSIWVKKNGSVNRNQIRDRMDDLDALPVADHDDRSHFILFKGEITPMNRTAWRSFVPGFMDTHYVMSSRGCPHNCTYCCNSALRNITSGPYLRRRSPDHFVNEMAEIKRQYPELKGFVFMDDSFFYGNDEWFSRFGEIYREKIGLPFFCWANPSAVKPERIGPLVDAGLVGVHVGLESGSRRISEDVYKRKVTREEFYACMDVLHRHRRKIVDIRVDVITDNPYETEEDIAQTVDVLSYLKKPFFVGIVSLIFYPRTELERQAILDGLITHGDKDLFIREFFHYRPTYLNRLMRCIPTTPGFLIRYFLKHRKNKGVRAAFYLYYFGYFVMIRRRLRSLRRSLTLAVFKRFGHHIDPAKIVTTRVALIDF